MICKACGKQYRKGRTVYAADKIAGGTGLARQRVCPKCAGGAVLLLVSDKAVACRCGAVATTCGHCVDKKVFNAKEAGVDLKALAKKIRLVAKSYEGVDMAGEAAFDQGHEDGRMAGLKQAADIVAAAIRA